MSGTRRPAGNDPKTTLTIYDCEQHESRIEKHSAWLPGTYVPTVPYSIGLSDMRTCIAATSPNNPDSCRLETSLLATGHRLWHTGRIAGAPLEFFSARTARNAF